MKRAISGFHIRSTCQLSARFAQERCFRSWLCREQFPHHYAQKLSGASTPFRAAVIPSANSPHLTTRRMTMIGFKGLFAAALLSAIAVAPANAQLPTWASQYPDAFQAEYPNRDVLNGGALTPAGRMGLEHAGGAAPVFGASSAYAARLGGALSSSCVQRYRSYDPASGTFLGHDGRHHACE